MTRLPDSSSVSRWWALALALSVGFTPSLGHAQPAGEAGEGGGAPAPAETDETPSADGSADEGGPDETPPPEAPEEKPPAEVLFDQGLKDMLDGKYETACPALAESFRLDPAPGALFTLAECELGRGRYATAQTHYRDYIDRVERMTDEGKERQRQRVDVAREKLDELEGKVPMLTLRLPADAPSDVTVKRDGERVAPAMLGRALPVDPGEYTITVEGPERRTTEQTVSVSEGGREDVLLLVGRDRDAPLHPLQIGAVVAGSVGLAALVGGTIAGAVAVSKANKIDEECNNAKQCTPEGLDAVDTGQAAGTASTVLLVVGAVGVGAAFTLWFLAPSDEGAGASDDGDGGGGGGANPYGVSSLGLQLAPRAGGGTVGLTLTF